jgi:hypothetical protein
MHDGVLPVHVPTALVLKCSRASVCSIQAGGGGGGFMGVFLKATFKAYV